jgi:hypothetical protein
MGAGMSLPGRPAAGRPPPPARSASGAVTAAIAAGMASLAVAQVWAGWRGGAVGWLAIGPLLGSPLVGWCSSATLAGAAIALALGLVVAHPSHARTADAVRLAVVLLLSRSRWPGSVHRATGPGSSVAWGPRPVISSLPDLAPSGPAGLHSRHGAVTDLMASFTP